MSFRARKTGSHLAGEGVSKNAADASEYRGLVSETRVRQVYPQYTVAALRRFAHDGEWHHELNPAGKVVKINYYDLADIEDARAKLDAEPIRVKAARARKAMSAARQAGDDDSEFTAAFNALVRQWEEATGEYYFA